MRCYSLLILQLDPGVWKRGRGQIMMPRPLHGVAHTTRGDGALLDGYPLIAMRPRLAVLTLVLTDR